MTTSKEEMAMKSGFLGFCTIVMVAVCVGEPVYAQGEPDDCGALCVCVLDQACTDQGFCDLNDCESTQFILNCTSGGTYKFELVLSCADCEHCLACAIVTDPSGGWVGSLQAGCIANQCSARAYITLAGGTTYTLHACVHGCQTGDCNTHCSGCTAKARVYRFASDCSTPCDW